MKNQKEIFSDHEADNYFIRNHKSLSGRDSFIDVDEILSYIKDGFNILEIGSSEGTKLDYLERKLPEKKLKLYGIDPSSKSIEYGRQNFKNLNLSIGTSDLLSFEDNYFDVVIVGFCLYVVDRDLVFKTVAEIDRVLKPNGFVVITDFEPPVPFRKIYAHTPGVYTFKNNYCNFFTGGGHYNLIRKIHYSHAKPFFDANFDERVATSVLVKEDYNQIYPLVNTSVE